MNWKIIDRPGYFGSKRDEMQKEYDRKYGMNNWRVAWQWGELILQRPEALQIYEDGYYEHLKKNTDLSDWLSSTFCNVYDTAPSNIKAEFSYAVQETTSNHLHDVAVRRALMRNGKWFSGKKLLEIRSVDAEGWILSPCNIPFHIPSMIYTGNTKYQGQERDFERNPPWWLTKGIKNSVEEFYQQNKVLQVLE